MVCGALVFTLAKKHPIPTHHQHTPHSMLDGLGAALAARNALAAAQGAGANAGAEAAEAAAAAGGEAMEDAAEGGAAAMLASNPELRELGACACMRWRERGGLT